MSLKLLSSDAPSVFMRYREKLHSLLAKLLQLRQMGSTQMFQDEAGIHSTLRSVEQFLMSDQWQQRHIRPLHINMRGDQEEIGRILKTKMDGILIAYRNCLYLVRGPYAPEDAGLLVKRKVEQQISDLAFQKNTPTDETFVREPIPEAVRHEVWRRDEAKCVRCGSQRNLEYDHIIPFSRGGANSARNLQLLCETCNRKKGASL